MFRLPLSSVLSMCLALVFAGGCQDSGLTVHNSVPKARITSHATGDRVWEGMEVVFRGTVSDPDGDAVAATWLAGGEVICAAAAPDADGVTNCAASLSPGMEAVTLEALDEEGASSSDRVVLEVVPNETPVVTITRPHDDDSFYADEAITFSGRITDAEDDPGDLSFGWTSDVEGDLTLEAALDSDGRFSTSGHLSPGDHQITLWATDSGGKTGTASVSVVVAPENTSPSCEITSPPDGDVGEPGASVAFVGVADDAESAPGDLSVRWSSDVDGQLSQASPDSHGESTFTTSHLSLATHLISFTVTDPEGASCTDQVHFTVGSPPRLTLSSPGDGDVYNLGEAIPFTAEVADDDHGPAQIEVSWVSSVDGEFSTQGPDTGGRISFSTAHLSRASHAIRVTATDPDGFYSVATADIRVNGLPGAPVISLGPAGATTLDDLEVTMSSASADPEGDPVSYTYAWYRNGVLRAAYTTDTLPAAATARDDSWRVVVTPTDGHGSGTAAEDTLVVTNTPPTAPVVEILPDEPMEEDDDLVCQLSTASTDVDGDSVSYTFSWTVDGAPFVGAGTTTWAGDTVSGSETVAEDQWTCTVTPTDGTDSGSAGSDTVDVLGQPIDYAHLQYPCSATIVRTTGTLDVYCWVYQPGVTDDYGEGAGITGEVGYGATGSDPSVASWAWFSAGYNTDKPAYDDPVGDPPPYANDEYVGVITAPSATGTYDYACRFSTDSGLSWTYVDLGGLTCGGDGSIDGYDPADAGELTVVP